MNLLWIFAGFCMGWMTIDLLCKSIKCSSPFLYRIATGFIGSLIVYTIL